MRIGVLGTGTVGTTVGAALVRCGHDVTKGSLSPDNPAAAEWAARTGGSSGTFATAADRAWSAAEIIDLGGIRAARGMEMYLPLWLSLMGALGTAEFNAHLARR